ncbi:MAG: aldehyde dehydrogenase family protein [Candidatus Aenigmatarchaeota archaeon]
MTDEYKNYINGRWVASKSGKTFVSINPANGKTIGRFQTGTEHDVDMAIEAAENAFKDWSSTPAPKRAEVLLKAAQIMRSEKERLAKIVTTEMGKVLKEGRGDVQEAIDTLEYFAGEGRRLFGNTTTSELKDKFAMTIRRPVGVVGVITPWNFPVAIPSWKIAPALVCGNAIVFKPATDTPLCAIEFVKILEKAGLPGGVVNMVTGHANPVGMSIIHDKRVRGISFTGSKETGDWILKNAGIKKVGLELGGKNGIIIMDDADLNLALDGVLWGAFGTTGQRCTAASRVILHEKIAAKFTGMLVEKTKSLVVGDGLNSKTDVGPLINRAALEKVHTYVKIGIDEGAKLLCGGEIVKGKGFFYKPTIFGDVKPGMRIAREEIFGPILCVITVKNFDQAIDVMNETEYGLSSAIYTADIQKAFKAIAEIDAGLTYINSSTIGSEVHLPFGGVKGTGTGTREAGIEGINEFSETKTVYVDYSGRLQKAQID